ncbi:hypothetical protein [Pseudomonas pergaminensis]
MHWVKFYVTKAGLVASPKWGHFIATDVGRVLLTSNPARIGVNELKDYDGSANFTAGRNFPMTILLLPSSHLQSKPARRRSRLRRPVQSALRAELLERIIENNPAFFEQLIVDLLMAMRYGASHKNAAT